MAGTRRIGATLQTLLHAWLAVISATTPLAGPFATHRSTIRVPDPDFDSHECDLYWPTNATRPLRFVSFAHGAGGGLIIQPFVYHSILHAIASWGYVVAATRACLFGSCHKYYERQLRVADYARKQAAAGDAVFSLVNFTGGVGVSGHSMGGQATLDSSLSIHAHSDLHDVAAAVMLHAYTHERGPPSIPFLAFTGDADTTAPAAMSEGFFDAAPNSLPRGLVNKVNATHQEPTDWADWSEPYNPLMAQFVVGWFRLYLDRTPYTDGIDWDALVYDRTSPHSLCGGGDGPMVRCEVERGASAAVAPAELANSTAKLTAASK